MQQNHVNLVTAFACALLGPLSLFAAELPAEYVRVDYVETRGNQWIDTGYYPGPQTIFEGDVKMVGEKYNDQSKLPASVTNFILFGALDNPNPGRKESFCGNFSNVKSDEFYTWCYSGEAPSALSARVSGLDAYNGKRVKLAFDSTKRTFTYGGLTCADRTIPTNTLQVTFGIGGLIQTPSATRPLQYFNMRIYGWKIWTGEKLERDYVPCVRRQDNVAGLYDLQNGEFKPSAGDPFAYQVPVALPVGYVLADYVETRGNQWIDTGYYPGPQTIVEGDVQMVGSCSLTADGLPFGAKEAVDRFYINFGNDSSDHLLTWCGPVGQAVEQVWGAGAVNGKRDKLGFNSLTRTLTYGSVVRTNCSIPTNTLTTSLGIGGLMNPDPDPPRPFKYFNMRIYGWKIWTGEKLERDYVPCVRERDNVAGLYDLHNKVFKPSAGDPFVFSAGNLKSVCQFGGQNNSDCITFNYRPALANFSASAWVKNVTQGCRDNGVIFSQGSLSAAAGFSCYVVGGSEGTCILKCQVRDSKGVTKSDGTDWTAQANDGKWHLVTVTYDKSSGLCCLYVDAELKTSFTQSAGTPVSEQRFLIGARDQDGFGFPVKGCVAEVSLWDRVLKPKEIKRMLYGQLSGKETGLLGYWPLTGTYDDLTVNGPVDCVANGSTRHNGTWSTGIEVVGGKVGFWPKPGLAIFVY